MRLDSSFFRLTATMRAMSVMNSLLDTTATKFTRHLLKMTKTVLQWVMMEDLMLVLQRYISSSSVLHFLTKIFDVYA